VVLERDVLERWLTATYGWPDLDRRITEQGFAFVVNHQPAAYLDTGDIGAMLVGASPLLVTRDTGEVWQFGSAPVFLPLLRAATRAEFDAARHAPGVPPTRPRTTLPG
jgi:hypothetical protein